MKKKRNMKQLFIFLLFTAVVLVLEGGAAGVVRDIQDSEVTVPLRFDNYYTHDMVIEALQKLHRAYPHLTKLDLVGRSEEGRSIYCMTVNNPKTGDAPDKPGIYVDGNIHGNEIQGAEVALYLLDYVLGNWGKNKEITQLVDRKCFYVVPVVNPDGRYHFMNDANTSSTNRSIRQPRDDDHDGLVDEDFPDDLDGDGSICQMRKRDPQGKFKTDPEEPRLLVRVQPGEQGEWTLLGEEGIDNDGDGRINEDAEGFVDANRNWGFDWQPQYVQHGSGDYPLSGVGLKALADYLRQRPNICMVWAFHNFGGMYLRGPSAKTLPEYHPQDIAVYDFLGKQSERITPAYRYLISWKDLYNTYGDFAEWMGMINGSYCFVGELSPTAYESFKTFKDSQKVTPPGKGEGEDAPTRELFMRRDERIRERLKFSDHLTQGELYKPWKPFKHPTYGDIEIGGWVKYSSRIPAPFMIKDMVHRNASAVIFSAKHTPDITMEIFDKKKIGTNLYRLRVRLLNSKAMPTMSYHAQQVKLYPRDMLKVYGNDIKVIAGGRIENVFQDDVAYKEYRPEMQFFFIPGFAEVEYQFLVSGTGTVNIKYASRHAGKILKTVPLQ
jgi:hypothetical protein